MGSWFSKIFKKSPDMRVLLLGLDSAGKTTTLYALKTGKVTETVPTIGFNVESVKHGNISFDIWDVGGQDRLRPLWRQYYAGTSGIIFVVDSNDTSRFELAKNELHYLMKEVELQYAILVVIANKQDLPKAVKPDKLKTILELDKLNRENEIFAAVANNPKDKGIRNALDWLSKNMKPI